MRSPRLSPVALVALAILAACGGAPPAHPASPTSDAARVPGPVRIASLPIPGPAPFVAVARDVVDVVAALDPSVAASAGLFDDALRVPSFSPAAVTALVSRIDRDLATLRALPWRSYSVDEQIDYRWVFANAETARRQLVQERLFEHRPAQWLESVSNTLIAFVGYAPDRPELQRRVFALVPAMMDEVRALSHPTRRDVETASKITSALIAMATQTASPEGAAAATSLRAYAHDLETLAPTSEFTTIGAENYAWRYAHTALLPWTPDELLREAETGITGIDAEIADLKPKLGKEPEPTAAQQGEARSLTRESLLGLYDGIESSLRAATLKGGWVSIPDSVGLVRARETPDAMVPLTGDGGSMNPPPTYATSNVGYWNVEHFKADWSEKERLEEVTDAEGFLQNGMGPYAAHEGYPGHFLQLSIARQNKDPLRSVLPDSVQDEGWALYVERVLFDHGGFGDSLRSRSSVLRSLRFRMRRIVYDVNVERGAWDLQRAADYVAAPAQGKVSEEILRAIQWPTQLISYFAGDLEIIRLREAMKKKLGDKFDERAFHDAFLAEGSIPVALIRAKMLGEAVPAPEG